MKLYLIRHGIAVEKGTTPTDAERPLTPEGDRKTRQVAKRLQQLDLHFDHLLTSPLIRAHQTAIILKDHKLAKTLEICDALTPDGQLEDWLNWLASLDRDRPTSTSLGIALVGHEPNLTTWAEILIWGQSRSVLTLKKAGIIGLELPDHGSPISQGQLYWLSAPKLLL